jgi:hypothetical protein
MRLRKWTGKLGAIALGGAFVVTGAWYGIFWRSETSHLRAENQAETNASDLVASMRGQVSALEALQKKIPAERSELALLRQEVPDGPSLDQLLVAIANAAGKAGVVVQSIGTPEPSDWGGTPASVSAGANAGPQSIAIPISVSGDSMRVLGFISTLETEPRLFVVTQFSLNTAANVPQGPQQGSGQGSTTVSVEAFYVSANGADPAANFPIGLGTQGRSTGGAGVAGYDFSAKAEATDVLSAEMAYYSLRGQEFLNPSVQTGWRALDVTRAFLTTTGEPASGRVFAEAGNVIGSRFAAVGPGKRGRALLLESLSDSGSCFYVIALPIGSSLRTAYAETDGGCAASITLPRSVDRGSASSYPVSRGGSGVSGAAWFRSW